MGKSPQVIHLQMLGDIKGIRMHNIVDGVMFEILRNDIISDSCTDLCIDDDIQAERLLDVW